jgi:hypothetical protein
MIFRGQDSRRLQEMTDDRKGVASIRCPYFRDSRFVGFFHRQLQADPPSRLKLRLSCNGDTCLYRSMSRNGLRKDSPDVMTVRSSTL